MYVHLNASRIIYDRNITVAVTLDHFVETEFWIFYRLLNFFLFLVFSYTISKSYVAASQGTHYLQESLKAEGAGVYLESKLTWISELVDKYTDWLYLFTFRHRLVPFLILTFSVTAPFCVHDAIAYKKHGTFLIHNFLIFMGITFTESDRDSK